MRRGDEVSLEKGIKQYSFELKPCPFCGSQADIYYKNESGHFFTGCSNEDCRCELPPYVLFEKDHPVMEKVLMAVGYWNERYDEAAKKAEEILK